MRHLGETLDGARPLVRRGFPRRASARQEHATPVIQSRPLSLAMFRVPSPMWEAREGGGAPAGRSVLLRAIALEAPRSCSCSCIALAGGIMDGPTAILPSVAAEGWFRE